jgi:hypothetical protein
LEAIFNYSKGIPRIIHLLGEHAIINAYAEQKRSISPYDIFCIASNFDLVRDRASLWNGENFAEDKKLLLFPALSHEQTGPLSGLPFLLREPRVLNAPAVVDAPARTQPAQPTEQTGIPALFRKSAHPATAESIAATQLEPRSSSPQKCSGRSDSRPANSGIGRLPDYWRDVARSFRRDARVFYSNCTNFLLRAFPFSTK